MESQETTNHRVEVMKESLSSILHLIADMQERIEKLEDGRTLSSPENGKKGGRPPKVHQYQRNAQFESQIKKLERAQRQIQDQLNQLAQRVKQSTKKPKVTPAPQPDPLESWVRQHYEPARGLYEMTTHVHQAYRKEHPGSPGNIAQRLNATMQRVFNTTKTRRRFNGPPTTVFVNIKRRPQS